MDKQIIDLDYTEVNDKSDVESKGDITINTDPFSTLIHETMTGVCRVVNNITNAVKEYNICRQREETKRAEIRAYLKIGIAEINAKKEVLMKQLDNQHELNLEYIRSINDAVMKQLDSGIDAVKCALEMRVYNKVCKLLIKKHGNQFSKIKLSNKIFFDIFNTSNIQKCFEIK